MTALEKAVERIERYRRRDSDAVRLARLASLAVRIEPYLLRRLRLELLPELDVGTEADVWFGPLVESRGADAIVLDPHAADVLREDLASDRELFRQVRQVTEEAHRNAPPTIRLEEDLNARALLNEGDVAAAINEALHPAIRAVYEGGDRAMEIAHWVRRAYPRLHRAVRRTQGAISLLLLSDALLGSRPLTKTPDADVAADGLAWILSSAALATRVPLGIELLQRGLRFVEPKSGVPTVELPHSEPMLLELEWTRERRRVKKLVEAEAGRTVDLEGPVAEVTVRTVAGDEYLLERVEAEEAHNRRAQAAARRTPIRFDNDVFLSYSIFDNRSLVEGQPGWVSSLHRSLEARLAQLVGSTIRIWWDPKQQGNDVFSESLLESLPRSAVFIAVLSPRYVKSEWCQRELEEFLKASAVTGGVQLGDRSRVFKVLKAPVALEQHPPALRGILGYEFFKIDRETGELREFAGDSPANDLRGHYWVKLDDLAHDISDILSMLAGEFPLPVSPATASSRTIYLAETSSDLRDRRDAIKTDLLDLGHAVLPERPLPLAEPQCSQFLREQLAQCTLSVHMVGENYGVVAEASNESIVVLQHELAVERGLAGDFGRVIWMPPQLKIDDERQRMFVERLEKDPGGGADLVKAPLHQLMTVLRERLKLPPERANGFARSGLKSVYLICEQRDVEAVQPLADVLFKECEVILPIFDADEQQLRESHQENLKECDAALVFYGEVNELWVRRKMRELQKSAGLGRVKPWLATAVYVGPPATPEKARFRTHDAIVIRGGEHVSEEALRPFFEIWR